MRVPGQVYRIFDPQEWETERKNLQTALLSPAQ